MIKCCSNCIEEVYEKFKQLQGISGASTDRPKSRPFLPYSKYIKTSQTTATIQTQIQKMDDMSDDSLEAASSHKTRDLMATKYKLLDGIDDLDQWEVRERYVLTREILGDGTYGCVVKVS